VAEKSPESGCESTARERAKRLGWRVDPPPDVADDPGDRDPTPARKKRPPRDAAADGWGRP
jgi:hypothetical protein